MLDELVDRDVERLSGLEKLISQKERVARAYNKKSKVKVFPMQILFGKLFYLWIERIEHWENGPQIGKALFELSSHSPIMHMKLKN